MTEHQYRLNSELCGVRKTVQRGLLKAQRRRDQYRTFYSQYQAKHNERNAPAQTARHQVLQDRQAGAL